MDTNILQRIKSFFKHEPGPKFVAGQLCKPSGSFANQLAESMDRVNGEQYDLTLETMTLQDNESILEIGFGSGSFFEKLFLEADGLHVTDIDYSQEMLDLAKAANQTLIGSGRLHLYKGQQRRAAF